MGIQKMSPKFRKTLKQLITKFKLPIKELTLQTDFKGLIHFAEVRVCNKQDTKNPLVILSIDRPTETAKSYFVSGVHFYSNFSKMSPKFLVSIQWLVKYINQHMK